MKLKKYLKDKYYLETDKDIEEVKKDLTFIKKEPFSFKKFLVPAAALATFVLVLVTFINLSQHNYSKNSDTAYNAAESDNELGIIPKTTDNKQTESYSGNNSDEIPSGNIEEDGSAKDNSGDTSIVEESSQSDESGRSSSEESIGTNPTEKGAAAQETAINPNISGGGSYAGIGDIDSIDPQGSASIVIAITVLKYNTYEDIQNNDSIPAKYDQAYFEDYSLLVIETTNGKNYTKYEIDGDTIILSEQKEFADTYQYFEIPKAQLEKEISNYKISFK